MLANDMVRGHRNRGELCPPMVRKAPWDPKKKLVVAAMKTRPGFFE
jgi:hypothetical protein